MPNNFQWNGDKLAAMIRAQAGRRLDACRTEVQVHARDLVGREGAVASGPKGKLRYGARRSRPSEPPMKQTGRLQSSIASERENLVARIGTNVPYGRILELLMNRPWLRRALAEREAFVKAVMTRPMDLK